MLLPRLAETPLAWIIEQVAEHYIDRQRKTYRGRAVPLLARQRAAMQPFFLESILDSARLLVLADERVGNPPFYGALAKMRLRPAWLPNFSSTVAITFVDTIVSHEPFTDRLLFHELVHVVQYEKLGLQRFAAKYVRGFLSGGSYEGIPLEINAYEMDARFAEAPTRAFSVSDELQAWSGADRF